MGEIHQFPDILLKSIFVGFGVIIPILKLTKSSDLKIIAIKDAFVLTAVQVLRVAGLLFFILWCIESYINYMPAFGNNPKESFLYDYYFWLHWYSPLMYFVISQLFWIKKLYLKKAALITLSLFLLILPSQFLLGILVTNARDYLPSSWTMYTINPLLHFVLNIIVFIFIIIPVMLLTGKLKKLSP